MEVCDDCGRGFPTKRGLGVHRWHHHKQVENAAIELPGIKVRWRDEELRLMASEEAKAIERGVRFINLHLLNVVPGRSQEAIKGVRRRPDYRLMVIEARRRPAAQHTPGSPAGRRRPRSSSMPSPRHRSPTPGPPRELSPLPAAILTPPTPARRGEDDIGGTIREQLEMVRHREHFRIGDLIRIAESALAGEDTDAAIVDWMQSVFPPEAANGGPHRREIYGPRIARQQRGKPPSRRTLRRRDYARVQAGWKKHRRLVAREILEGGPRPARHDLDQLVTHWAPLLGHQSEEYPRPSRDPPGKPELAYIWDPISAEEIERTSIPVSSAPGPDMITARQWRSVPPDIRALFFNVVMLRGGFPRPLLQSRTVFIPKMQVPSTAGDYRPISIAPVAIRQLNRILASRLRAASLTDERQRAFISADGTAENTAVLDTILWTARARLRELHVATLDVAKAFDTVSHAALLTIIGRLGLPKGFQAYVAELYEGATTRLAAGGRMSPPVPVRRGVRQGDPLSPILFNLVVNDILTAIPSEVGFVIEGERVSGLAFADDLTIVTGSKWGMQRALSRVEQVASSMGLALNASKCAVLSMVPAGKVKKMKVIEEPLFRLRDGPIHQTGVLQKWRYLGGEFSPEGTGVVEADLSVELDRITRAPLKPQQRVTILRLFLLPRVYHAMALGNTTAGRLSDLDRQVRRAVRAWLRLPDDTTVGYFHASAKDGGLGIPSLSTLIPSLTISRLGKLRESNFGAARAAYFSQRVQRKIGWAQRTLRKIGVTAAPTAEARRLHWANVLHESVDGQELRESSLSTLSSNWVHHGTDRIPGRDYVQHHHIRVNCLPTLVRTSRGRRRAARRVNCRAGCDSTETAAHVIRQCWRTHGGRVKRHDAVCGTLAAGLRDKGWETEREKAFSTCEGVRKPDIIARKGQRGIIIDAQVVSGVPPLQTSHVRKRGYYANNGGLIAAVAAHLQLLVHDIETTTCTLSWRGVWCEQSHQNLSTTGLSDALLGSITTRVLQGSHTNWTRFNQMTGFRNHRRRARPREGVG